MSKNTNSVLIEFASDLAPWLGTFPTAWAIGAAVVGVIGWPWPVAVITGAAVELLGLASNATALMLYNYQINRKASDPAVSAQLYIAGALVLAYFLSTVILTAVLEQSLVLALFPVLSLVATFNLALRYDHAARLVGIAKDRDERKLARQAAKLARQESQPAEHDTPYVLVEKPRGTYDDFAAAQLARNGSGPMSAADVASMFGVPTRTAYNWLKKYKASQPG